MKNDDFRTPYMQNGTQAIKNIGDSYWWLDPNNYNRDCTHPNPEQLPLKHADFMKKVDNTIEYLKR